MAYCGTIQYNKNATPRKLTKPVRHKDMSSHIEIIIAHALKMVFYNWAFQQAMASNLQSRGERTTKKDHLNPIHQNTETSRGACLIFRATNAALIRGRRLFKH